MRRMIPQKQIDILNKIQLITIQINISNHTYTMSPCMAVVNPTDTKITFQFITTPNMAVSSAMALDINGEQYLVPIYNDIACNRDELHSLIIHIGKNVLKFNDDAEDWEIGKDATWVDVTADDQCWLEAIGPWITYEA